MILYVCMFAWACASHCENMCVLLCVCTHVHLCVCFCVYACMFVLIYNYVHIINYIDYDNVRSNLHNLLQPFLLHKLGHRLKAEISTSGCLIQHVPIIQCSITYICMQYCLIYRRGQRSHCTHGTSLQKKLYKCILIKDTSESYNKRTYLCII